MHRINHVSPNEGRTEQESGSASADSVASTDALWEEDVPTRLYDKAGPYWGQTPDPEVGFEFEESEGPATAAEVFSELMVGDLEQLAAMEGPKRAPTPYAFESLSESLRAFKRGESIQAHLISLSQQQRTQLLAWCKASLRPDGAAGVAKQTRKGVKKLAFLRPAEKWTERMHILHTTGVPRVPKPARYTRAAYLAWINGESSHVRATRPGSVPVLNEPGVALLGHGDLSDRVRDELLHKAEVVPTAWSEVKTSRATVSVFRRELCVGPLVVRSLEELQQLGVFFAKHKPVYRVCQGFFSGDRTVQHGLLAATLDSKVFPGALALDAARVIAEFRAGLPERSAFALHEDDFPSLPPILERQAAGVIELQGNSPSMARPYAAEAASAAAEAFATSDYVEQIGARFASGISRGARDALAGVDASVVRSVLNVVLGLASMAVSTTPLQFGLAVAHTVVNDPIAFSMVQSLRAPQFVEFEGKTSPGVDAVDTGASVDGKNPAARGGSIDPWWAKMAGISLFSSLREFIGEVYASLVPSFVELCGAVKFASLKAFSAGVAAALADLLVEFFNRCKACYTEWSLEPLIRVSPARWCKHTSGLLLHKDYILSRGDGRLFRNLGATDELPARFRKHMMYEDIMLAVDEHIAEGEALRPFVKAPLQAHYQVLLGKLSALKAEIGYFVSGNSVRPTPFAVMFCGPPGRGKSVDADEYMRAVVRLEGRSLADVYHFRDENFRTALRASTTCVRMDDPDAAATGPVAGHEDHVQFFQHVVNNTPYSIEQAGVEEKGKHFARITDVVIASNFTDLGAATYCLDPSAVWRRIQLWIEPEVKKEYATPDGRLDISLSYIPANPCTYSLYRYKSGENRQLLREKIASDLEWGQCMRRVHAMRARFLAREYGFIAKQGATCPECMHSLPRCTCLPGIFPFEDADVVLQGNAPSLPRSGLEEEPSAPLEAWQESLEKLRSYFSQTSWLGVISGCGVLVGSALAVAKAVQMMVQLQGRSAGVANDSWFRAENVAAPALPPSSPVTWSREQARTAIANQMMKCIGELEVHAVVIRPGYVLSTTHLFGKKDVAEVHYRGRSIKFRKDSIKLLLNAEYFVVELSELSGQPGVATYWSPAPVTSKRLGDAELVYHDRTVPVGQAVSGVVNGFPVWKYQDVTSKGDCGGVLLAEGPGGGVRVYGMHCFGLKSEAKSAAGEVTLNMIDAAIRRDVPPRVMYQGGFPSVQGEIQHFPPCSEINVANTFYNAKCILYGSFRVRGKTVKTQFKPTSFHDAVKTFAESEGIFYDYAIPEFRGHMDPASGLYFSPYIHALRDTNVVQTSYMDCVPNFVEKLLGHYGGPLSEREAIQGVPGEFNSINLKTSMGPPFGGPKTVHINRDAGEFSPEFAAQVDELESILRDRKIPILVVEATLKDEVLKRGKNARVFCQLPAAFNFVAKQRFAVLKRVFRASYFRSRCFVGMDFGSRACEDFIQFFLDFKYLYDMDVERMDKMWTPQLWDAVAQVFYEVTEASAGERVAWEAWALVMALKEAIINLKGDLFSAFWNPSGNDVTVELNSIALCLLLSKVLTAIRAELSEGTFGDDLLGGAHDLLPEGFFRTFKEITGFTVTDGRKRALPTACSMEEASFLKRRFRYDTSYRVWTAPLEQSSIVKMLLYRGKSSLSPPDHEAELVRAAARYAVLHGGEVYARWKQFLSAICPDCVLPDFDESMRAYARGEYSDWVDRVLVHDGSPSEKRPAASCPPGVSYEGGFASIFPMHSISSVPASVPHEISTVSADPTPVVSDTPVSTARADAVAVVSAGETQVVAPDPSYRVLGTLPDNSLNDFVTRWTRLTVTQLSAANTGIAWGASAAVGQFQPATLLLSNAAVDLKTENWTYYRGDVEVMGVVSIPGNASGAYVISAVPGVSDAQGMPASLNSFFDEQCMAYEHSTLLLCSASTNIEMTLPFFSLLDANTINDPQGVGGWTIRITCLSPLRSAVPGGVTTGSITWYARFKDYELLVPRWEGLQPTYEGKEKLIETAKSLKANKTVSKTAATIKGVAEKMSGIPFVGQAAGVVAGVAGTVGAIADFFGFSRENEEVPLQHFATRSTGNVALIDAPDTTSVAGFSMRNKISLAADLTGGAKEDPMAFDSIGGRWCVVSNFVWSAADAANTVLREVFVSPGFAPGNLDRMRPTGAGYCLLPFEYWRCDFEYLVVIPASVLHRGTLQVLYIPPDSTAPVAADNVTNVGLGAIMDISSATAFQLSVGFASNRPMLRLQHFTRDWAIIPVGTCNGTLQFRVVNPLVSQNPTDSLNVVVFARAKNIQAAVPRVSVSWPNAANTATLANPWEDTVSLEGKVPGDDDCEDYQESVELVPGAGPYPVADVVAGEDIRSLRALAQRPSRLGFVDGNRYIFPGAYGVAPGQVRRLTTAVLAVAPFVCAAASERLRIFPRVATFLGAYSLDTTAPAAMQSITNLEIPAHCPMTHTGPQFGAEFTFPYYFPARGRIWWRVNGTLTAANAPSAGRVVVMRTTGADTTVRVYYSLGDDIRVGPFMRIPGFAFERLERSSPAWF